MTVRPFGWCDLGLAVNTLAAPRSGLFALMDELATWRDVERALGELGRGAKNKLAIFLEMDPSYLGRKLKGNDDLSTRQVRQIKAFLDEQSGAAEGADGAPPRDAPRRRVPVYGYGASGAGDMIAFNPGEIIEWMELPAGLDPKGDVFVVRAIGSNMEPRIFDGESLVVQRRMPPVRDRDAVVEFNDGTAVVKTYRGQRDGHVFTWQYNPPEERRYPADKVKAIHAVYCRL
jgi:phage repressor protein C with HTH and peptisase S24 domain